MAQNQVGLYNLALSAIGTRAIVDLPSENSREAEICNLWYEVVRDTVLRAAPWSSARNTVRLGLLATRDFELAWVEGDPEPPWLFTYAQPSDFLYPRYLDNFQHFQLGVRRITNPASTTPVIFTNVESAILVYTYRQTDMNYWDADLYHAVSQALAAAIAMPLHGKAGRAKLAIDTANAAIMNARAAAANENTLQYDHVPDWLIARGVTSQTPPSGYVFPSGPLLSVATFAVP